MDETQSLYGNPWRFDQWNLTLQGKFLLTYGRQNAEAFAVAAGTKLGGSRPSDPTVKVVEKRVFIFSKTVNKTSTSAPSNQGFTGDGPPGEVV